MAKEKKPESKPKIKETARKDWVKRQTEIFGKKK